MVGVQVSRPRVGVAADQPLVADAVRVALQDRGFDTVLVDWPSTPGTRRRGRFPDLAPGTVALGLALSELDSTARVEQTRELLRGRSTRWLVMTGAPRGQAWGAVLEAGALDVVPIARSLDEVIAELDRIAAADHVESWTTSTRDRDPAHEPARVRAALVQEWLDACEEREASNERRSTLTPRERQVLELLHTGSAVLEIAARLEVSPATVRSQVKAILRKLKVNTQLAAVAAFEEHVAQTR